ncbi:MAG: hypothetical protein ACREYB_10985 [Casimicrobiaceae bacterium]
MLDCPRCDARPALTHDLQRTTHFSYCRFSYCRCTWGHGRLTRFVQFVLEKNFVRPLSGNELAARKARIRTVQCSNCSAPVDLHATARARTAVRHWRFSIPMRSPIRCVSSTPRKSSARPSTSIGWRTPCCARAPAGARGGLEFEREGDERPSDYCARCIQTFAAGASRPLSKTIFHQIETGLERRGRKASRIRQPCECRLGMEKLGKPSPAAPSSDGGSFPAGGGRHKMLFLPASEAFMTFRLLFLTSIAGLAFGASSAPAQTPAPAAPAGAAAQKTAGTVVAIPPHTCVRPEFPGKLASSARINTFNKDVTGYGDCIKKYIEEVRNIAIAATAAGNSAIDEYNAYTNDLKAKVEAAKD